MTLDNRRATEECKAKLMAENPLIFAKVFWPDVVFYNKQREVIESVQHNQETVVPAAHQMGKDFVSGFIVLWYFLTHHPVRIITTSVKEKHLEVLWGEIGRFINTSKYPLTEDKSGPLIYNHLLLRKKVNGVVDTISYCRGMVSEKGEGFTGHHAKYTLAVFDECSGIDDEVFRRVDTWAKKKLLIGNTYDSGNNYFERAVKDGDIPMPKTYRPQVIG